VRPARTEAGARPASLATRSARPRSAADPVTTTSLPASRSARATADQRSGGQRRASLAAPGCRRRNLGGREPQVGRIRRDPGLAEQAAPPLDLVFARSPRDAAAPEGDQAAGPGGLEDLVALRAATVEVDG
jgi:hypothetical protein